MYSQSGPEKWRAKRKPGCPARPVAVLERLLDDVVEIPHGLMVVNGEQEGEVVHSGSFTPALR
jgi:hypothetical protein